MKQRDEIVIQAPIEAIWDIQTSFDEWPSWQPDVDGAKSEGPLGVGSVFRWQTAGGAVRGRLAATCGSTKAPLARESRRQRSCDLPTMHKGWLKSVFSKRDGNAPGELGKQVSELSPASGSSYWEKRKNLMYYKYVDILVRAFGAHARSVIDVGSWNTPLLEEFDWIPERHALDLREPYQSGNVRGTKADFLTFSPAERYDLALCLQVLEHVPDPAGFARHLFEVAENVLVSVPFMWDESRGHIHDFVNREKLVEWMGREPDYDVLVSEPLTTVGRSQRLIAYYHSDEQKFNLAAARGHLQAS